MQFPMTRIVAEIYMPGNELIFAWLLTIDKSYDVLQLGGGTPKWGKFGSKNEISNDSNCGQNI